MTNIAEEGGTDQAGTPGSHPGYRRSLFDRFSDSYGIVLLLIVATIVLAGLAAGEPWGRPVIVVLMGATLQVGLAASRVSPRQHRNAGILSTILVVVAVGGLAAGNTKAAAIAIALMAGLLVILLPVAIVRGITDHTEINVRTIAGALCIYLLAGLFFAFLYMTMDVVGAHDFFAESVPYHPFDFIYFSFITMTTVGYGDFTAAGDAGRMLAVLEALLGQIYLVTIVALLVGNMGRQRERRRRQERVTRVRALRLRGRRARAAETEAAAGRAAETVRDEDETAAQARDETGDERVDKAQDGVWDEIEDVGAEADELRAAAAELLARADDLKARAVALERGAEEGGEGPPAGNAHAGRTDAQD